MDSQHAPAIVYRGNKYVKHSNTKGGITYWCCHRQPACNGQAVSINMDGELKMEETQKHNHEPDANNQPNGAPLKKLNIADLEISSAHFKTLSNQQFLFHDNIIHNEVDQNTQRTIIFATEECIRCLFANSTWYIVNTLQIGPTMFSQLWILSCVVNGTAVPLVYVFMQTRKEEEYLYVLLRLKQEAMKQRISQLPSKVMVDFSMAAMDAVKGAFPNAEVLAPVFKLEEFFVKKIQDFSLLSEFKQEEGMSRYFLCCALGLAFVPVEDVEASYQLIMEEFKKFAHSTIQVQVIALAEHLDKHFLRGTVDGWTHGRSGWASQSRLFPTELWNNYERALNGESTTDAIMAHWSNHFLKTLFKHRKSLSSLINSILIEQNNTEKVLSKAGTCDVRDQSVELKANLAKSRKMAEIVRTYPDVKSANGVLKYLSTIGRYHIPPKVSPTNNV